MVYCTECGREQADAAKFCRYCGDRMPGLELTTELKREAAAIQQSKSGTTVFHNNLPQIRKFLQMINFALEIDLVAFD